LLATARGGGRDWGRGRARRATDAASRGPGKKKGAAGKGREMGRLTAKDEAARTNGAGAGAAPGGEGDLGRRERDTCVVGEREMNRG
jgi:hypothetical protein